MHDLQATMLHCLGLDHTRLTYHHMGRDFRLTDVAGKVVRRCWRDRIRDRSLTVAVRGERYARGEGSALPDGRGSLGRERS